MDRLVGVHGREIAGLGHPHDIGGAGGIDEEIVPFVEALRSAEVGGIDKGRSRGVELGEDGVPARLGAVVARLVGVRGGVIGSGGVPAEVGLPSRIHFHPGFAIYFRGGTPEVSGIDQAGAAGGELAQDAVVTVGA